MKPPLPPAWRPVFHVRRGVPYHVENSVTGLNRAAAAGFPSIDLDWQLTMPDPSCPACPPASCVGHAVNTHWLRPLLKDGFTDPKHQLRLRSRVDRMTLAEASRLVTRQGHRIHTAPRMFREAVERDLRVLAELKHGRYAEPAVMASFAQAVERAGAHVRILKLSSTDRPLATLKAAKAAGFATVCSARSEIPRDWYPFIDYRRGPIRFWR